MPDTTKLENAGHDQAGNCRSLTEDLVSTVDIQGRNIGEVPLDIAFRHALPSAMLIRYRLGMAVAYHRGQ